jgi:predicted DNA-binding transcriptional regulator AlpA
VENVCAAGATIDRIEPDPLVNLSDIAARTDLTRAAISKYAKADASKHFPAPVARVTSAEPLWDWSEVATWMVQNKKLPVEVAVAAGVVKEANAAIGRGEFHMQELLTERAHKDEACLELLAA